MDEAEQLVAELESTGRNWTLPRDPRLRRQFEAIRQSTYAARLAIQNQKAAVDAEAQRAARKSRSRGERAERRRQATAADKQDDPPARPTISFTREIAPLLMDQCVQCHQPDDRSGGLSAASFASLQRGGQNGVAWEPGKGSDSLLIRKLLGTADGQRMPLDGEPFSNETVTMIREWIDAGARYDGGDPAESLEELLANQRLLSASASELNSERRAKALEHWSLAFPHQAPQTADSAHFFVVGAGSVEQLAQYAQQLEAAKERLERLVGWESDAKAKPARVTVFVLTQLYDASEFARMVEQRMLPRPLPEAFWKAGGTDAYLVIRWPEGGESDEMPVDRGVTGIITAARGGFPDWFVDGLADAVALKVTPELARAHTMTRAMAELPSMEADAADFFSGRTPSDMRDAAACGVVQALMRDRRRFTRLMQLVSRERPFAEVLSEVYELQPDELVTKWWSATQR